MRTTIAELRKKVLTLAVSGKLVPQDPREGTGEDLYQEIQKARAKAAEDATGRKKILKPLPPISSEEIPFEIPESWKWVRLGEIVKVQTGTLDANASSANGKYPFFTCADQPLKIDRYAYDCECVLIAGNGNFNVKYYDGKFEAYQRTYIIEAAGAEVFVPYIFHLVQMQTDRFKSASLGSTMPYIRLAFVTEAIVSLPPFLEQKRIVEKVKQIMRTLDLLEREAKGVDSVLDELEKKVLTLAVSGKLVPQDPREGTGEDLYQEIQKARAKAAEDATGRKKILKPLPPISSEEIPFEIPESWKWVRAGNVCDVNPRNDVADDLQVSFLPMTRIFSEWGKSPDVSEKRDWKSVKAGFTHIAEGDVVLAKITPCFENEKSGVARNLLNNYAAGTTELHVFRGHGQLDPEYLLMAFKNPFFVDNAKKNMTGTAGQKRVPTEYVVKSLIALPPLAEQKRIVEKVQDVMSLIKKLRQEI